MGNSCDFCILFGHALRAVYHEQNHIRALNSSHCTDNAVSLDLFFNFIFTPQACGIDKYILSAVIFDRRVDGISGRSRNIRYDHAIISGQAVHQR